MRVGSLDTLRYVATQRAPAYQARTMSELARQYNERPDASRRRLRRTHSPSVARRPCCSHCIKKRARLRYWEPRGVSACGVYLKAQRTRATCLCQPSKNRTNPARGAARGRCAPAAHRLSCFDLHRAPPHSPPTLTRRSPLSILPCGYHRGPLPGHLS
jgi:hypothetical protein